MTALLLSGWAAAVAAAGLAWAEATRARRIGRLAAQASHEVRGPLAAAQLALDGMTLRGEVDAARTLPLELQLRRARRALDDLHGGVADDRPQPVPLAALAGELEAAWRPVVAAHGRRLCVRSACDAVVLADRTRLAQAAGNLLANALEHGTGPVRLSVAATPTRATVAVTDAGPGPARPLPDLLAPPPTRGGALPRHGHGLRVAADVAAHAGGRLSLSGATFALELPRLETEDLPRGVPAGLERRAA